MAGRRLMDAARVPGAWALVVGAAITTARMIAIRYTAKLLRGQQQIMTETAATALADNPDNSAA